MARAIDFGFLPFDSHFQKLQNCIFSEVRNHLSLGSCLDTWYLGHSLVHFWLVFNHILAKKQQSEAKIISYPESALKTELIHICFKSFWELSFFSENSSLRSPSRIIQKWFFSKWWFYCLIFLHFTCNSILEPHVLHCTKEIAFLTHITFWPTPEGDLRDEFSLKNESSRKYLKHISIDSVFNADSDYDIIFASDCYFLTKIWVKTSQKCTKLYPDYHVSKHDPSEQWFLTSENMHFDSYWK